ncbi:MAG: outer membrane protein assembly factor BamD, partial [Alphaproteobacteria bacterium]
MPNSSGRRGTIAGCIALLVLSACGTSDEPAYVERPVEELYNDAVDQLAQRRNGEAARLFEEVERQ